MPSDGFIEVLWSGPFDAETPDQGTVRVGDRIRVPAGQAEGNPHFQPIPKPSRPVKTEEAGS